jgi:F0F1-type ATP synthase membrane subunit b/b'
MNTRQRDETKLIALINHCILLNVEEKKGLLKLLPLFTDKKLLEAIKSIQDKNKITDQYLKAALAQDKNQNYLKQISQDIKKAKREAKKIYEKNSKSKAEQKLKEEIQNL